MFISLRLLQNVPKPLYFDTVTPLGVLWSVPLS